MLLTSDSVKDARLVRRGFRLETVVPGEFLATGIRTTLAEAVAASSSAMSLMLADRCREQRRPSIQEVLEAVLPWLISLEATSPYSPCGVSMKTD